MSDFARHRAKIDVLNADDQPLRLALQQSGTDNVKLLVSREAESNVETKHGQTAYTQQLVVKRLPFIV